MIGGTACNDHHAGKVSHEIAVQLQFLEGRSGTPDSARKRSSCREGLLVDLLQHERLAALLLSGLVVPVDLNELAGYDLTVNGEPSSGWRQLDDVAVLDQIDPARVGDKGCDHRCAVGLTLTQPDDQRALPARCHQVLGVVAVHGKESKVTFELFGRFANSVGEVTAVLLFDKMGGGLGIGVAPELVAASRQLAPELSVVLDDSVQDERKFALAATGQRMGVFHTHLSVCGPARVADTGR